MDPSKLFFFEAFAPVALFVGLAGVVGWVITTWLRMKHGYPLEGSWGNKIERSGPTPGDRRIAELAEENRRLVSEMGEMRQRVAVLERLATDPAHRLEREIAGLDRNVN